MIEKTVPKLSLLWFLVISFTLAWALFLLPLVGGEPGSTGWQRISLFAWSVAMWAPGLAAILVRRFVEKRPLSSLNLRRLGPKWVYLWAWLLPFLLTVCAGLLTWLFGVGEPDLEFTAIRQAMAQAGGVQLPPLMVVLIQIVAGLTVGPLFNTLFALGEELGWRGYLLGLLQPLGQLRAILLSGIVWGVWHMPAILQGHNYPRHPIPGVFMMIVFCVLFGAILSWFYLRTRSPWSAALGHGSLNAIAGLPILFMPTVDLAFGGPLTSLVGWIPLVAFVGWLIWSRRLPVEEEQASDPPVLAIEEA